MTKFHNKVNLDGVTSDVNGEAVNVTEYRDKTVFIQVTANTDTVTVNVETSPDNTTWYNLDTITYTGNATDLIAYNSYFPTMRTTTTSQTDATVTTKIVGRE